MDAVKFIEERRRMVKVCRVGPNWGLYNMKICAEDVVKEVEEWAAANPRKTRQSVFLEQWPGSEIDESGCLMLCPLTVSAERRNRHGECTTLLCSDCRREFWMQEVE